MGLMDDAQDKGRDMKTEAQDKMDSTNIDDKARAEFDKMRGDKRADSDQPMTNTSE